MQIGKKHYKTGQLVRIQGIVEKGPKITDSDLNGRIGRLVPRFQWANFGVIGVEILNGAGHTIHANLEANEFVPISEKGDSK